MRVAKMACRAKSMVIKWRRPATYQKSSCSNQAAAKAPYEASFESDNLRVAGNYRANHRGCRLIASPKIYRRSVRQPLPVMGQAVRAGARVRFDVCARGRQKSRVNSKHALLADKLSPAPLLRSQSISAYAIVMSSARR